MVCSLLVRVREPEKQVFRKRPRYSPRVRAYANPVCSPDIAVDGEG